MIRVVSLALVLPLLAGCASDLGLDHAAVKARAAELEPDIRAGCSMQELVAGVNTIAGEFAPVPGARFLAKGLNRIWDVACADPADTARALAVQEEAARGLRERVSAQGR